MTTRIVGRAFIDAYRQAAANAKHAPTQQAVKSSGASPGNMPQMNRSMELTRKSGISLDEAVKILNLSDTVKLNEEQLKRQFDHLFKVNDQKSGGSFYLQSKVVRAKERVEMEWEMEKAGNDHGQESAKK